MGMSGLDRGKATEGPANDGPGVAKHDIAWSGGETAPTIADPDAPVPDEAAPVLPPPAKPVQRAASPWHHSRPRRAARRGATAPGKGAVQKLFGKVGTINLPVIVPPAGRSWWPWLGGAAALLWLAGTSLHPVGPHEQAIVTTFSAAGPAQGPGLAISWPWPISSAHIADVTGTRHLVIPDADGEHLLLTRDGGLVDLAYDVRWHVRDLHRLDFALADPDATLRLAAGAAMRSTLAGMDFVTATTTGRTALAQIAARRLQATLDGYQAGIAIDGIDLRRADPPARVADAVRAVAAARNDAATEAIDAQSWARQTIIHAEGEARAFDRIEAQYHLAPEVTRRQMYYATMDRVLSQSDKVIVDAPGVAVSLPPLPAPDTQTHAAKAGDGR